MKRLIVGLFCLMVFCVPMIGFATPIWVCDSDIGKDYVVEETVVYRDDSNNGHVIQGVDCNIVVTLNEKGRQIFTERFKADETIVYIVIPTTRFRVVDEVNFCRQNDYIWGYTRSNTRYSIDLHTSGEAGIVNINDDEEFLKIFRKAVQIAESNINDI